jgi:hypothetical protein
VQQAAPDALKERLDGLTLRLQSVLYQRSHLEGEIRECHVFGARPPRVELVPVDEFRATAPPELLGADAADEHALMLNRLAHELVLRERLKEECALVEEAKRRCKEANDEKRGFLGRLGGMLKDLGRASAPIQEYLALPASGHLELNTLAQLLPTPLYVLYRQVAAYRDSFMPAGLSAMITGSMEEAALWREPAASAAAGAASRDPGALMEPHPLTVVISVGDGCSFSIEYLPRLHILAVCPGRPEDAGLLCNLVPDDTGRDSPNPANAFLVDGNFAYDPASPWRPYKWAQWLGGLDFLADEEYRTGGGGGGGGPVVSSAGEAMDVDAGAEAETEVAAVAEPSPVLASLPAGARPADARRMRITVQRVIEFLQLRLRARAALASQYALFEAGQVRLPPGAEAAETLFPLPAASTLSGWRGVPEDTLASARWEEFRSEVFAFTLSRAGSVLSCTVRVSVEYPIRAPVFTLSLPGCSVNDLACLAREANVFYDELLLPQSPGAVDPTALLTLQIRQLQQAFDIYAQATSASAATSGLAKKYWDRPFRGRDRRPPLSYDKQRGLFDQRRE